VTVVTAGVHDAVDFRTVRMLRFLENGKRIHVRAEHDRSTGLRARENADYARLPNAFEYSVPETPQPFGHDRCRSVLFKGHFRVHMEVAADKNDVVGKLLWD
jgi:hypothetical protein